jgi:sialate O-acetylesterase
MAILLDIGEKDDIHPANKQDVGKRLALFALDNDYNFDLVSSGPLYKNHVIFKDYIQVDFDNTGSGLVSRGILKDFEIAGADSIFLAAKAEIVNNKVRVWSNKVSTPIHVRYGWKNWMVGTLFNKEKLPASSFNSINEN